MLDSNISKDVSKNSGFSPKSSILIGSFHYKPSILGYPYFWKHPRSRWSNVVIDPEIDSEVSAYRTVSWQEDGDEEDLVFKGSCI